MEGAVELLDVEVCKNSKGDDVLLLIEPSLEQNDDDNKEQKSIVPSFDESNCKTIIIKKTSTTCNNNESKTTRISSSKLGKKLLVSAGCGLELFRTGFRHDKDDDNDEDMDDKEIKKTSTMVSTRADDANITQKTADNDKKQQIIDESEIDTVDDNMIMKYSNLYPTNSNKRTIWIVTTAALPWRTGTSVNPLWRAVYLAQDGHKVTLLVPWLDDIQSRKKLYGSQNYFPGGSDEQREWLFVNFINKYQQEKNKEPLDFNIQIQFWNGTYQESFGSIFPIEDLCSLIPNDEADVAILEEPEHLNWFRVIHSSKQSKRKKTTKNTATKTTTTTTAAASSETSTTQTDVDDVKESNSIEDDDNDDVRLLYGCPSIPTTKTVTAAIEATARNLKFSTDTDDDDNKDSSDENEKEYNSIIVEDEEYDVNVIGWVGKFKYVIGILHTNYGDYIRQYGVLGTSLIGASALHALSSLVVRAYCNKVIKLSDTLPSYWTIKHNPTYKYPAGTSLEGLADLMETTCNVHGVRTDFLDPPVIAKEKDISPSPTPAPVYFIGKLIWAKGFEQVLEIQELYKSKTGEYFPMDVYGSGNDEKAIQRAFFGRHNPISRGSSTLSTETSDSGGGGGGCDAGPSSRPTSPVPTSTELAVTNTDVDGDENIIIVPNPTLTAKTIPGAATADTITSKSVPIEQSNTLPLISEHDDSVSASNTNVDYQTNDGTVDPLAILSDVTQKTVGTGVETADATVKMVESLIQKGWGLFSSGSDKLRMAASTLKKTEQDPENKSERESADQKQQSVTSTPAFIVDQHNISIPFHLAPARARFKWRRHPIPARFLGVQDHIVVRDIPQTKIFLNMSTSEVLCTTSAEALAMGKFVILPKHPSNLFFLQFPNCLAYGTLDECVSKMQYALSNDPEPLNDEFKKILSWEGATERLYKAAAISKPEETIRRQRKVKDICLKAAKFHAEASKKSHFIGNIFAPR